VDFNGRLARFVRLTITSGWGVVTQQGLSEVRFFFIPTWARHPQPADGDVTQDLDVTLKWCPGREADDHQVHFSTDEAAVTQGQAIVGTTTDAVLDLSDQALDYGTTYYWSITEVNDTEDPNTHHGDIRRFNTPEGFVIDSFDQYDDYRVPIFFTWLGGLGHSGDEASGVEPYAGNGSGSVLGNLEAPFAEWWIVRSGQSLSMTYNNSKGPFYSEIESVAFALPSDWTPGGSNILSLYFRGYPIGFREHADGRITMNGMGRAISDSTDEFRFAYKELTGDGTITARLDSLQEVADWTRAGVMMRNGLSPDDLYVQVDCTASQRTQFQYRSVMGQNTGDVYTDEGSTPLPMWIRLTRSGSSFQGQRSSDGVNWEPITTSLSASMVSLGRRIRNPIYVGLAVTSSKFGHTAMAEFSNVSVTGNVSGDCQLADMTVEQVANDPDSLYIAVEDHTDQVVVVEYPDPAATQIGEWTRWDIPLSHFDSLDLGNVQKFHIGVGDRDNAKSGGQGKMFFDDICIGKQHD